MAPPQPALRSWCILLEIFLLVSCIHLVECDVERSTPKRFSFWGRRAKPLGNNNNNNNNNNNSSRKNITFPEWQKAMPHPLSTRATLKRIMIPTKKNTYVSIYLLGTSHVSNDSSADVRVLLHHVRPDVVFLELCEQRIPLLLPEKPLQGNNNNNMTFWEKVRMVQENSNLSRGSAIGTILLTQVQDDYADSLGVELGGEFRVAWEYCNRARPICVLGDRPLQLTLLRAWESLSWFGKIKCLIGLVWSSWQKPDPDELRQWMKNILDKSNEEVDLLTESMVELRESFPSLERVILKERDAYLAAKLYQTCRYFFRNKDNVTMVAIVGAGHSGGICDWLTNGNGQTPEEILSEITTAKGFPKESSQQLVTDVVQIPHDLQAGGG